MKNTTQKIGLLFFILLPILLFAQDFQGKAYYQTKTAVDMKMENSKMSSEQQKMIQEMMRKQFEKTYVLTFNKEESVYKEEEKLGTPTTGSRSVEVMFIGGSSASETLYANTKNKTYVKEKNLFGKPFLVKDSLKIYDWKLEDESKIIGKYLCFKATATQKIKKLKLYSEEKNSKKSEKLEEESSERTITVWYTTDIPVNHGPDNYWGLPGLIMELNVGKTQYVCTKIVMNAKDKIEIKEPTKGEVITNERFNDLMQKKLQEMQDNQGRQGRGKNSSFSIQIGG